MVARNVIALNTTTPQAEVPQTGDTYEMPGDVNITGDLTITGGISGGIVALTGGTLTKTLNAAGAGDFTTMAELVTWLDSLHAVGATVDITVIAGTYSYDQTISVGTKYAELYIHTQNSNDCTVNTVADPLFEVTNSSLRLQNMIFHDTDYQDDELIKCYAGSSFSLINCTTSGFTRVAYAAASRMYITGGTHDDNNDCFEYDQGSSGDVRNVTISNAAGFGISVNSGAQVYARTNNTITNSGTAFEIFTLGSGIILVSTPTLSGNSTDYNIPLNEIQYYGGYIADGTGPLSFKV